MIETWQVAVSVVDLCMKGIDLFLTHRDTKEALAEVAADPKENISESAHEFAGVTVNTGLLPAELDTVRIAFLNRLEERSSRFRDTVAGDFVVMDSMLDDEISAYMTVINRELNRMESLSLPIPSLWLETRAKWQTEK